MALLLAVFDLAQTVTFEGVGLGETCDIASALWLKLVQMKICQLSHHSHEVPKLLDKHIHQWLELG
jgi:hypothetical protein